MKTSTFCQLALASTAFAAPATQEKQTSCTPDIPPEECLSVGERDIQAREAQVPTGGGGGFKSALAGGAAWLAAPAILQEFTNGHKRDLEERDPFFMTFLTQMLPEFTNGDKKRDVDERDAIFGPGMVLKMIPESTNGDKRDVVERDAFFGGSAPEPSLLEKFGINGFLSGNEEKRDAFFGGSAPEPSLLEKFGFKGIISGNEEKRDADAFFGGSAPEPSLLEKFGFKGIISGNEEKRHLGFGGPSGDHSLTAPSNIDELLRGGGGNKRPIYEACVMPCGCTSACRRQAERRALYKA